MVKIERGDLVKADGTEFHIKESGGGEITYWAKDVDAEFTEDFASFVDRCEQSGGIIIEPYEGKFGDEPVRKERERYFETA